MRFELEIPPPAAMLAGKEDYISLGTGTELHRIHHRDFPGDSFNGTARGNARFSPIRDRAGAIIPTIYAAQTFECATCEIILRCPDTADIDPVTGARPLRIVNPSDYAEHEHCKLETSQDLRLVDLTIAGQRKIGVDQNALLAGPRSTYPRTREWAERIHAECPSAQGIYYNSFQLGPKFAVLLFGDRIPADMLDLLSTRPVTLPAVHEAIRDLADSLSIDYADV